MKKTAILALLAGFAPMASHAADIVGANVGASHFNYLDADSRDQSRTNIGGQMEVGFTPQFSLQGDMALNRYWDDSWDGHTTALHAIYNMNGMMKFGARAGFERIDGDDYTTLGVEYKGDYGMFSVESAYNHVKSDDADMQGNLYNVSATMPLNSQVKVGGRLDYYDTDDVTGRRYAATGEYDLGNGYAMTGELGFNDANHDDAESYVGIGLRADLGQGGVSFSDHSLSDLIVGH
ncbi:porin [Thioclava sp. GXIMD2076]|uniref:Porin n=1 Tax=Thioclava kandeliae TaxID=3070818 RepID=A0ABV1SIA9_9RHOB